MLEIARGIVDSLFLPIAPLVDRYPLSEEQRVSGAGDMSGRVQSTAGRSRPTWVACSSAWKD